MSPMLWAGLIPVCVFAAWFMIKRPLREVLEDLGVDGARDQFRLQREGLEARFLSSLGRTDPVEKLRWDEGHWHDEVVWARDRRTRSLLALVCVIFHKEPFDDYADADAEPRHSTALFEFRNGKWHADGKRLDEVRPDEALIHNERLEPIFLPHRRV